MSGIYNHNKLQTNINRYIKELNYSLVQTSPRLTNRSRYSIFEKNSFQCSKISLSSITPEPFKSGKSEIRKALDYLNKPTPQLSIKKPVERLPTFKIFLREDPAFRQFIEAMFSTEASAYKKSSANSDIDNVDVISADKILIEARKIIKSGIRKKKRTDQSRDDVEYFWANYISRDKVVRWDIFEENFITFVKSYMVTDLGAVRKVNWKKFLMKVFAKYCKDRVLSGNWQQCPSYTKGGGIGYKSVSVGDLCTGFYSGDLFKFLEASVDEVLPDPIRHKLDQEYFYTCGCVYRGQWKEGRRDGSGLLKLCSKERYEGYFVKGLYHSYGILCYEDFEYKGFFRKDFFHGFGKLNYPNGSVFEGVFIKGSFSKGALKFDNGQIYQGEFLNQNFEGKGELNTSWGEVHKGMWSYGKLNGDCKIVYTDGTKLSGVFINGEISNYGKLKTAEYTYIGEFQDKIPNGSGKFSYRSGISYEGQVKNGKLEGTGRLLYPNGDTYEGEFRESEENGQGKLTYKDGRVYQGQVSKGKPHGNGEMLYPEASKLQRFVGMFENGEFSGNGEAWLTDSYFCGNWENGEICGRVLIKCQDFEYDGDARKGAFEGFGYLKIDGGYYSGNWVQGKLDGSGEVQDPSMNIFNGMFKAGQPVIKCKVDKGFIEKLGSINLNILF